jgi:hypothetical protein
MRLRSPHNSRARTCLKYLDFGGCRYGSKLFIRFSPRKSFVPRNSAEVKLTNRQESTFCEPMSGYGRRVTKILADSTVLRALYTANTGTRTMSFNNGAGPGGWVAVGAADGRSRWAFASSRRFPEPEASRRGCPARDQAEQRGGPELERGERMTRVPLYLAG